MEERASREERSKSSESSEPERLRLSYFIDLVDPTEESLYTIKNKIVEKISRSVLDEMRRIKEGPGEGIEGPGGLFKETHSRHLSLHSSG